MYQQITLSPKLGVVGISTLWQFRLPLPIQMFIKVASSPRLSGIGMPSPILWSHPLKMQRIVLLSSLLWWELGTNSLITGPGQWLPFRRFTSKLSWSWSWPQQKYRLGTISIKILGGGGLKPVLRDPNLALSFYHGSEHTVLIHKVYPNIWGSLGVFTSKLNQHNVDRVVNKNSLCCH